jgi:hypothetical protein
VRRPCFQRRPRSQLQRGLSSTSRLRSTGSREQTCSGGRDREGDFIIRRQQVVPVYKGNAERPDKERGFGLDAHQPATIPSKTETAGHHGSSAPSSLCRRRSSSPIVAIIIERFKAAIILHQGAQEMRQFSFKLHI